MVFNYLEFFLINLLCFLHEILFFFNDVAVFKIALSVCLSDIYVGFTWLNISNIPEPKKTRTNCPKEESIDK